MSNIEGRLEEIEAKIDKIIELLTTEGNKIEKKAIKSNGKDIIEESKSTDREEKFHIVMDLLKPLGKSDENSRYMVLMAIDRYPKMTIYEVEMAIRNVIGKNPSNGDYIGWFERQMKWDNDKRGDKDESDRQVLHIDDWREQANKEQAESLARIKKKLAEDEE